MYILDKVLHKVLYLRRTKMESKKKKVGPARPPSNLIRRRSPVVISASRAEASGACTKHVKRGCAAMRFGTAVCPLAAVAASIFTKWFSDSRNLARSSDVSSVKQEGKLRLMRIGRGLTSWLALRLRQRCDIGSDNT